jgi:type III secretory pathway component EscU
MTTSSPSPNPGENKALTPLRSLTGAFLSATMGLLLYQLTKGVIRSFAEHPTLSHNQVAINLSVAVRTLVIGLVTMATGIFAFVALGLVGLAVQLALQKLRRPKTEL